MKEAPLISVLVPAYNVSDYVDEAINSLLEQTYKNIEIIIVDDCSTDDTLSKLYLLQKLDSRIKVYKKEYNSGIVDTLNLGLEHCNGEFIARMDADDIAINTRLEQQLNYLYEHPELDIVGSSTITISMNGELRQLSTVPVGQKKIERTLKLFSPCFHIWLAKKNVYKNLNGYRSLAPAEDYDFLLRAATDGFKIDNIAEPLMKIRVRDGNTADIAGLKQRKAHKYVVNLYEQRLSTGKDNYTDIEFAKYIKSSESEKNKYEKSIVLIKKGFMQHNRMIKIYYFFIAAITSKWQFSYSINRILFKMMIK
ncbi:glycosyltransferase family 2 protein [Pluralibacter gergoviae]|uniref:glycosyltransferase family 2 protein n=1 Tax=Pluralibacter gergoviae TaxID=61647 RepID=UPI003312E01D|nr:glycosyltransferase [Pluralibacter gergoviae]